MPTAYPRILITRTPHVDDLIKRGRTQLGVRDDYPASALFVELAESGLRNTSDELLLRRATGQSITPDMVAAALDDD